MVEPQAIEVVNLGKTPISLNKLTSVVDSPDDTLTDVKIRLLSSFNRFSIASFLVRCVECQLDPHYAALISCTSDIDG